MMIRSIINSRSKQQQQQQLQNSLQTSAKTVNSTSEKPEHGRVSIRTTTSENNAADYEIDNYANYSDENELNHPLKQVNQQPKEGDYIEDEEESVKSSRHRYNKNINRRLMKNPFMKASNSPAGTAPVGSISGTAASTSTSTSASAPSSKSTSESKGQNEKLTVDSNQREPLKESIYNNNNNSTATGVTLDSRDNGRHMQWRRHKKNDEYIQEEEVEDEEEEEEGFDENRQDGYCHRQQQQNQKQQYNNNEPKYSNYNNENIENDSDQDENGENDEDVHNENSRGAQLESLDYEDEYDEGEDEEEASFVGPMVQVKYNVTYEYDDTKFKLVKDEQLFLINKSNQHWWLCLRLDENLTFFVPASYVTELTSKPKRPPKLRSPPPRPPPPPPPHSSTPSLSSSAAAAVAPVATTPNSAAPNNSISDMYTRIKPEVKRRNIMKASNEQEQEQQQQQQQQQHQQNNASANRLSKASAAAAETIINELDDRLNIEEKSNVAMNQTSFLVNKRNSASIRSQSNSNDSLRANNVNRRNTGLGSIAAAQNNNNNNNISADLSMNEQQTSSVATTTTTTATSSTGTTATTITTTTGTSTSSANNTNPSTQITNLSSASLPNMTPEPDYDDKHIYQNLPLLSSSNVPFAHDRHTRESSLDESKDNVEEKKADKASKPLQLQQMQQEKITENEYMYSYDDTVVNEIVASRRAMAATVGDTIEEYDEKGGQGQGESEEDEEEEQYGEHEPKNQAHKQKRPKENKLDENRLVAYNKSRIQHRLDSNNNNKKNKSDEDSPPDNYDDDYGDEVEENEEESSAGQSSPKAVPLGWKMAYSKCKRKFFYNDYNRDRV
jgi:hypothetical protein